MDNQTTNKWENGQTERYGNKCGQKKILRCTNTKFMVKGYKGKKFEKLRNLFGTLQNNLQSYIHF